MIRVAKVLVPAFALTAVLACASATLPVATLSPAEARADADRLDGSRIRVYGFLHVSRDYIGLNAGPDRESECVGLLMRRERFESALTYDQHWSYVSGRMDADGCGGDNVCHDICGPMVIIDPEFEIVR